MEFEKLINDRFSCKKFLNNKVENKKIEEIKKAIRVAPTAKNSQPFKAYFISNENALHEIDSATPCRYNAPLVIVFTYIVDKVFYLDSKRGNSGPQDTSICATHAMFECKNLDLDSCWIDYLDIEKLSNILKIDSKKEVIMMMLDVGYKDPNFTPLENHYKRKNNIDLFVDFK